MADPAHTPEEEAEIHLTSTKAIKPIADASARKLGPASIYRPKIKSFTITSPIGNILDRS